MAYIADCCRAKQIKKAEEEKYGDFNVASLSIVDFYEKLIPLETGQQPDKQEEELT